ncbi:MAG: hypothetical protein IAG10_07530, partial [Planctomycetaceae bacterium]|nr:hypothetical protein [Planctomycetaceae bacterium]
MLGDRGRLCEVVAIGIRLEHRVDTQEVVRQEQASVQRLLTGGADVRPEAQELGEFQASEVHQLSHGYELMQELGRDLARHVRSTGIVAAIAALVLA